MAERLIERSPDFERDVKRLSRKHPDFCVTVAQFLERAAQQDVPDAKMIPGLEGKPVYKIRLPLGGRGKRGDARLIYYRDSDRILAICAFAKSDVGDEPRKQIRDALSVLVPEQPNGHADKACTLASEH